MDVGNFAFEIPAAEAASSKRSDENADDSAGTSSEPGGDTVLFSKMALDPGIKTESLKRNHFFEKPSNEDVTPMQFASLNLSKPLLKACNALKYKVATPIQAAAVPLILAGRDICGSAITGSGKTAAFGLPLLERLLYRPKGSTTTYVLIVAPTRELAVQIHSVMRDLAKFSDIQVALIVGGFSLQVQSATLDTRPEIVVATPVYCNQDNQGVNMAGMHSQSTALNVMSVYILSFDLDDVHAVVLDEADKLLRLGFIEEIKEILKHLPKKRQTMLFSATMTEEVKKLMQLSLHKPVRIAADPSGRVPRKLKQEIIRIKGDAMRKSKEAVLCALCSRTFPKGRVIIFCCTKQRAHRIRLLFEMLKLPPIGELHSNLSQTARLDALEKFRNKEFAYLVATDVAGRGLDIVGVDVVINYDAPPSLDTYLHRIGRTARAGAEGRALTFITDANRELLHEILTSTKQKLTKRVVPDEVVAYYDQQLQLHQRHLKLVEKQETEKESLEKAEIEAERVVHAIEHEKEIFARPKRTWFQTDAQRKATRKLALMEDQGSFKGDKHPQSAIDKKGKKLKKEDRRQSHNSEMAETNAFKGHVRTIKRLHRMYEAQGSSTNTSMRLAKAADRIPSGKKRHLKDPDEEGFLQDPTVLYKKRKKMKRTSPDDEERKTRVYTGGQKSRGVVIKGKDRHMVNTIKRGGKGKHTFKGKRKYKRR